MRWICYESCPWCRIDRSTLVISYIKRSCILCMYWYIITPIMYVIHCDMIQFPAIHYTQIITKTRMWWRSHQNRKLQTKTRGIHNISVSYYFCNTSGLWEPPYISHRTSSRDRKTDAYKICRVLSAFSCLHFLSHTDGGIICSSALCTSYEAGTFQVSEKGETFSCTRDHIVCLPTK